MRMSCFEFQIIIKVNEEPEIQDLNDDHEQDKVDIRDLMDNIAKHYDGCKGCKTEALKAGCMRSQGTTPLCISEGIR